MKIAALSSIQISGTQAFNKHNGVSIPVHKSIPMDTCSFGSKGIDVEGDYKNTGYLKTDYLHATGSVELKDAEIDETLKVGNNLRGKGTIKAKNIEIGGSARTTNIIVSENLKVDKAFGIEVLDGRKDENNIIAKNVEIGTWAKIHNADVENLTVKRSATMNGTINAKNVNIGSYVRFRNATVNIDNLTSGSHVMFRNPIKKLNSITMLGNNFPQNKGTPFLAFYSNELPQEKIKLIWGDFPRLVIRTPDGTDSILEKLELFKLENGETRAIPPEEIAELIKKGDLRFSKILTHKVQD